jgi:FHS family L-fucose permease-like MFS transporter
VGVVADATNLVIPFVIPLVGYILVGLFGFGLVVHSRENSTESQPLPEA